MCFFFFFFFFFVVLDHLRSILGQQLLTGVFKSRWPDCSMLIHLTLTQKVCSLEVSEKFVGKKTLCFHDPFQLGKEMAL